MEPARRRPRQGERDGEFRARDAPPQAASRALGYYPIGIEHQDETFEISKLVKGRRREQEREADEEQGSKRRIYHGRQGVTMTVGVVPT